MRAAGKRPRWRALLMTSVCLALTMAVMPSARAEESAGSGASVSGVVRLDGKPTGGLEVCGSGLAQKRLCAHRS